MLTGNKYYKISPKLSKKIDILLNFLKINDNCLKLCIFLTSKYKISTLDAVNFASSFFKIPSRKIINSLWNDIEILKKSDKMYKVIMREKLSFEYRRSDVFLLGINEFLNKYNLVVEVINNKKYIYYQSSDGNDDIIRLI